MWSASTLAVAWSMYGMIIATTVSARPAYIGTMAARSCLTSTLVMLLLNRGGTRGGLMHLVRAVRAPVSPVHRPARCDVLVDAEQIRRVIPSFDRREPLVGVGGIGLVDPGGAFVAEEADVDAAGCRAQSRQRFRDPRLVRGGLVCVLMTREERQHH